MAAVVANKVKRQRVTRSQEGKPRSELSAGGPDTPQLYQRAGAASRLKQLSEEQILQHKKKVLYYRQVIQVNRTCCWG